MSQFEHKKAKVERKRTSWAGRAVLVATLLAVAVGVAVYLRTVSAKDIAAAPVGPRRSTQNTAQPKVINMTDIQATVENGKITIPMSSVKSDGLVRFVYKGKQDIPLLAYLTPSGKLVTAVSICEPCQSTKFFIQDNKIVCGTCYSQWDIETLKGITGGCLEYPPDVVAHSTDGEKITIDESVIARWSPRV